MKTDQWAYVHADLSLRWAHRSFCWFYYIGFIMLWLKLLLKTGEIYEIYLVIVTSDFVILLNHSYCLYICRFIIFAPKELSVAMIHTLYRDCRVIYFPKRFS